MWELKNPKPLQIKAFLPGELVVGYLPATTAPRLKDNGFTGLAQIQVLFIYVGGMIYNLALQVTRPIFPAAMRKNSKNGKKKLQKKIFPVSAVSI